MPHNGTLDPVFFMKKPRIQTELNKLEILRHCYRMMAVGTWEAISVATLEAGMSKTRGAIFYFNKNKTDVFINMIDELFIPVFRMSDKDKERFSQCAVQLFFLSYKTPFERLVDDLRINYKVENPQRAFFNILVQAQNIYPGFNEILREELGREISFLNGILNPGKEGRIDADQYLKRSIGRMFFDSL